MGRSVCRGNFVDKDAFHCQIPSRVGMSSNVRVNGTGISRSGDYNNLHKRPVVGRKCRKHARPIAERSSPKVRVNGKACGRVGDSVSGCTRVATGSTNVFAG